MMLMTDDKKDDEATAYYDDRHTSAAAAGGGDGQPNNGREVWHRRRTTASHSRRHTRSERRARTRVKVNSIRKIYYFYNAQISLNKPSFSTRLSSLRFFSLSISTDLLVHVGSATRLGSRRPRPDLLLRQFT